MRHILNVKAVGILHSIQIAFKRLFIIVAVILVGTALLSIYSLRDFIDKMADIYKGNPNTVTAMLLIFIAIPIVCRGLEKCLKDYLERR